LVKLGSERFSVLLQAAEGDGEWQTGGLCSG